MNPIKSTVAASFFSCSLKTNRIEPAFKYPDTNIYFTLFNGSLYASYCDDENIDVYIGQPLGDFLAAYGIPVNSFIDDFCGKGLSLSNNDNTFSIDLDMKEICAPINEAPKVYVITQSDRWIADESCRSNIHKVFSSFKAAKKELVRIKKAKDSDDSWVAEIPLVNENALVCDFIEDGVSIRQCIFKIITRPLEA